MSVDMVDRRIDSEIRDLSIEDAIAFLEELQSNIDGKLDGLREDLKAAEQE